MAGTLPGRRGQGTQQALRPQGRRAAVARHRDGLARRRSHVDPKTARTTVEQWCATWLEGYATRRVSTVRQARVHIAQINRAFGSTRLADVRPSQVKAWTSQLKSEGYADSTVYATYRRLAQIMGDAVHDGIIARSPCSRRTSPGAGSQRPYVASTEQVWALHDAMPEAPSASGPPGRVRRSADR